ncbi:sphingomyelin phosphodiesterase-like protein [Leptotrombidium deliense]|uniref:Sphingomyelin phosphodiesterase n=1 Tax=Leptotrombidium deliense TaxID=299467 RepID=A0A443SDH9_9ACAR|nr:sphingomyelin phosphodiesterase-like protein [Leptotrombidium deliense]
MKLIEVFITFTVFTSFVECLQVEFEKNTTPEIWDPKTLHETLFTVLIQSNRTKLLEDVVNGVDSSMTCHACQLTIDVGLKLLFSEKEFSVLFSAVCELLKIEVSSVCKGLSALYSPQLFYIFKHTKLSAKEMCSLLIGPNCLPKQDYMKSQSFWQLDISTKNKTSQANAGLYKQFQTGWIPSLHPPPLLRAAVRRVLHLSDVHVDPNYSQGKFANCDEPLCCNDDSTGNAHSTIAGYWGSYGKCDNPAHTIDAALSYVSESEQFDYVMYTGDISPHRIWNISRSEVMNNARYVTNLFAKYFPNTKFFFPVVGNHESVPVNMFPPPESSNPFSMNWLFDELYNQWQRWIPESSAQTFKYGGYFSRNVTRQLRVIVLNTNFCARLNFWQLLNANDPGKQLKWLSQELQSAEDARQSVHIIGHIAPDRLQCSVVWLHNYLRILERYNETIKAQFFGHTHFDEIRIYESPSTKQAMSVAFIGGSLTTYENVNPMFRTYSLGDKSVIDDFETFYFNLSLANAIGSKRPPVWIKEYSAKRDYNMKSLLPSQFDSFLRNMRTNNSLFNKYYNHYTRHSDAWPKVCDDHCKNNILNLVSVSDPIL